MKPPYLRRLRLLRWLVAGLWAAGLPFFGAGCMSTPRQVMPGPDLPRLQGHHLQGLHLPAPTLPTLPTEPTLIQTRYQPGVDKEKEPATPAKEKMPSELPAPTTGVATPSPLPVPISAIHPAIGGKKVAVSLDLVFRLAEEQNPRIALARVTVTESCLEADLKAREAQLPVVTAGLGYYRHEGGIQNETGRVTNSSMGALFPGIQINSALDLRQAAMARLLGEREGTQARAELVKINNEVLLEAATAYVDLLTARRAEAVVREAERMQTELYERARKLAEEEPLATVLADQAEAAVRASQGQAVTFHQQGNSAAAKLAYLLGLDCEVQVVPLDADLVPLHLVDASAPVEKLVAQVQETGPGVRELQEILGAIQAGLGESEGMSRFLPTLQLTVSEGVLLGGPGLTTNGRNRFDVLLGVRWNLTEYLTVREKRALAMNKLAQVELQAQELRGKLVLAVRDGQEVILASRKRFGLIGEQISKLAAAYRKGREAIFENLPADKINIGDVLGTIQSLRDSHLLHVQAVQAHNHAQVRLLLLLGK